MTPWINIQKKKRTVAQLLTETISFACIHKRFAYEEETTLDFYSHQCKYEGEKCKEDDDESKSASDYGIENLKYR